MKILQMTIEKEMPEVWEMKRHFWGLFLGDLILRERERVEELQLDARVMPRTGKQGLL